MSYLDPKEQVIDLKLTSYGKYLLAIGKLKPTFYAFYDDDVIYDSAFAGVTTENQSEAEPRIQEETPRFATQTVYSGRELEIFSKNPNVINDLIIENDFLPNGSALEAAANTGLIKVQDQPEGTQILQEPLGMFDPLTGFAPAWNISFLKAPLSSSLEYLPISSSKGTSYLNIPQLESQLKYEVLKNSAEYNISLEQTSNGGSEEYGEAEGFVAADFEEETDSFSGLTFTNGSSVQIKQDFMALRIEESNTFLEKDNFEIEVFEILENNGTEEIIPLKFYKDRETLAKDLRNGTLDPESVEQYFDFFVDQQIDSTVMCPLIREDKQKQIYLTKIFNCEKTLERGGVVDLYADVDDMGDICK